jgi:hypothetical protein
MFKSVAGKTLNIKNGHIVFEKTQMVPWLMCVQRFSKHLKTCDIIFLNQETFVELTISNEDLEGVIGQIDWPHIFVGFDPMPWKKLHKISVQEQWQVEDWMNVFNPELESDSDEDDEEWEPPSDDEEDFDSETEDDE